MDRAVTPLPERADAVVIGGGIIGCSILYHLAKAGMEAPVLLERRQIGCGTTWHAAGIVGQLRESGAQTELARYTARLFRDLEVETGQATGYRENGTLHLALSPVRLEQLRRSADHAERMGIAAALLRPAEIGERWPGVSTEGVLGGFLVPSNGQVNPLDVTAALARGARGRGALIAEETPALRLLCSGGRITGVETPRGVIATGTVVLAAGLWSHRFAAAQGATVPLQAAEHFYIVTEPLEGLPRTLPVLVVAEERIYAKEDAGRLLVGAFEARAKPWGTAGIPEGFCFDGLPFDMDHAAPELAAMHRRLPVLAAAGIRSFFNGPESFTPDGRPWLGPAPEPEGLWIAAGMNSNGILYSGGTGRTLAEWIMEGLPRRGIGPLMAARAHPFQRNARYLAERVTESLGLHYGISWPGRQIRTARGIRRVPLHDRLAARGAVFAERVGWEVPMYFDPAGRGWPDRPTLGRPDWAGEVEAECLAVRDAALVIDQSMYGKLIVEGPDAVRALNRVCGAEADIPPGRSIYTQFLNDHGGIEADVTVTRLAPDRFLVLTGHPSQVRDRAWIGRHADPGWRLAIFDATSAFALLSLSGPMSRAILAALSPDPLDAAAFPFGAAREIDLAHARVWAIRRSYTGELGWELLIPAEFTAHVHEALIEAGTPLGLRHGGQFALDACRIEKAFRHFGHDIGEEDTPIEAGLGFAIALDKGEPCLGQAALRAQRAAGPPATRLAAIALRDADAEAGPFLMRNETVWRGDRLVGHVTSGAWGWRLGRAVGIASLHNPGGVTRAWLDHPFEVKIAGTRHRAEVSLTPFYDPDGTRMRG